jgi:type IV fimbrial biogenesis protein FimT
MVKRGESGISAIEVMVVIAVISIAAAMAVPAVNGYLPDYRVKRAAREMYSNLQRAKMAAVKECANCNINFSTGPDTYVENLSNKTIGLGNYGSGVQFGGPGGETFPASGTFTFNARGMCPVAGYAYLTNAQQSIYYRVGITTAGVVRMERHNPTTNQWN